MNCYTYIKRNWEHDEAEIRAVNEYLQSMNYTHQLLIFPEGTDLTEQSMKKSDAFAKKFNFPVGYIHHIIFVYILINNNCIYFYSFSDKFYIRELQVSLILFSYYVLNWHPFMILLLAMRISKRLLLTWWKHVV